jgi:plastocyanin
VRLRTIPALVVVLLASAACSSTKAASAPSRPASSAAATGCKDSAPLGSGRFTIGKQIQIGAAGFEPQVLVTGMGLSVTWTNGSSTTQSVHFDNWESPVDSGPIAPGASWSFKAVHTGSVLYHSTFDPCFKGQVQIQLTGNGSEPGG